MEESTHALQQTGLVRSHLQYSSQFMVGFLCTQITVMSSVLFIQTNLKIFSAIINESLQHRKIYRAQNLRQSIVLKTSIGTRVSLMGLGSFVDINIFVMKYYFI